MVIFIFQTIWLFIDDLAGKDLDPAIIGKFLLYYTPTLIDKVLPLTVLLSSILTFGTFAENYEFAAIKASGISLQKAMRSIIVFVSLLGIGTFFLANNVIPISEQKIFNMRKNIAKVKPAAVIVEGVFSDIEGTDMNMKVSKKSGDNDQFLTDVIIHEKTNAINTTVIKAKEGELISSEDSDIIQLVLKDGYYYQQMIPRSGKNKRKHPFARANFETYTKNIDVSSLNDQDLEAESDVTTDKMKNVTRLRKDMDSLHTSNVEIIKAFSKNILTRMGAIAIKASDTLNNQASVTLAKSDIEKYQTKKETPDKEEELADSLVDASKSLEQLVALLPDWKRGQVFTSAKGGFGTVLNSIKSKKVEMSKRYEVYNRHILSLHKKFALAFSCIILFFVGAPLGAIIRKGGIGLPMVVAILLFLAYYFLGVFAENYAKRKYGTCKSLGESLVCYPSNVSV